MAEFTGERVIPGQVQPDLWNEHFARYAFAGRLARGKRVLDIACGTGYGSSELAKVAGAVTGVDISSEAIAYAQQHFRHPNLDFYTAPAEVLPFADRTFDLIVAFEVIEHLTDSRILLTEARRLLTPTGQFIVSTPNRLYYEETRRSSGPNPYHVHEFEFEEYRNLLTEFFPHVSLFLQNHTGTIVFQPHDSQGPAEVRMDNCETPGAEAHFFVAVCSLATQVEFPTFVYVPTTANVLREREQHISLLERELKAKSEWLRTALAKHEALVTQHQEQTEQLQERNRWAEQLNQDLQRTGERVVLLQEELIAEQKASAETVAQYEAKLAELEGEVTARTKWALDTETRLSAEVAARTEELARCVDALHDTESQLEGRTKWALDLQTQLSQLHGQISRVQASRWYRMGRTLGLGPELHRT
ncbi:MAG TPA: methyltransferase domain-containing protein [Bryobacteraceae bacterium]|nr:methyltransferase domain-containing protein [Bryobacteraceae bacterium]